MLTALRSLTRSSLILSLGAPPFAMAAPAQQSKMKACNEQANKKGFGEGKGDERKAFMKDCLSAKPEKSGDAKGNQQQKMKAYNNEGGEKKLKGDE